MHQNMKCHMHCFWKLLMHLEISFHLTNWKLSKTHIFFGATVKLATAKLATAKLATAKLDTSKLAMYTE